MFLGVSPDFNIFSVSGRYYSENQPVWGSLDILEACGASDLGSNPSAGVIYKGSNIWDVFLLS